MITIGKNLDGNVILTFLSTVEEKPIISEHEFTPADALKFSMMIKEAANQAMVVKNERNRTNLN